MDLEEVVRSEGVQVHFTPWDPGSRHVIETG